MRSYIILLLVLVSCSQGQLYNGKGSANRQLASTADNAHVIFFIHGLMGNSDTFGELDKVLKRSFPSRNLMITSLTYPTAPKDDVAKYDELHPYDFAQIINAKIINYFYKHNLDFENTPYSLIVHSQGGLVSMVYLNSCLRMDLKQRKRCKYDKAAQIYNELGTKTALRQAANLADPDGAMKDLNTPTNIHRIISLGSPFWGSATANNSKKLARDRSKKSLTDFGGKLKAKFYDRLMGKLPEEQVTRLQVGSRGTAWQRLFMSNRPNKEQWCKNPDIEYSKWNNPYPKSLKIINVAGLSTNVYRDLPGVAIATKKMFEDFIQPEIYEQDIIVGAPEARLNFIYNLESRWPGCPNLLGRTTIDGAYYPINALHVPIPLPLLDAVTDDDRFSGVMVGMADIRLDNYVGHPGWAIIEKVYKQYFAEIEGKNTHYELSRDEKIKYFPAKLENFTSEIRFIFPDGYQRPVKIRRDNKKRKGDVKITLPDNGRIIKKAKLEDSTYVRGEATNPKGLIPGDLYSLSYYHIGKMSDKEVFRPRTQKAEDRFQAEEPGFLGYPLKYEVDILGFEKKEFTAHVMPTFNSFTEVYLKPYHPFKHPEVMPPATLSVPKKEGYKVKFKAIATVDLGKNMVKVIGVRDNRHGKLSVVDAKVKKSKLSHYITSGKIEKDSIGRCQIGLAANTTDKDGREFRLDDRGKSVPMGVNNSRWEAYAPSKVRLYRYFNSKIAVKIPKPFEYKGRTIDKTLRPGTPLEVLGRYATGKMSKMSGVSVPCNRKKRRKFEKNNCGAKYIDRYLVTSPQIRAQDGVKKFTHITATRGVRWINVVDVDLVPDDTVFEKLVVRKLRKYKAEEIFDNLMDYVSKSKTIRKDITVKCFKNKKAKDYQYDWYPYAREFYTVY
ncbi:MAG: hypothetical protein ISR65_11635 [Bacteriovoracaceae bacterium]|nr:hypothetical protein [Bacteriovoracaceae bacterium]